MIPRGGSSRACRTLIVTTRTHSSLRPPCPFAATQKHVWTALQAHIVRNTDRFIRDDQLLYGAVPSWVQGYVTPRCQKAKQAIHIFSNGLMQAVGGIRLLSHRHGVGRH